MNETSNSTLPYAARHEAADLVIAHDAMVGHALEVNGSTTLHGDVHVGGLLTYTHLQSMDLGLWTSYEQLTATWPLPRRGMYALVTADDGESIHAYVCVSEGQWQQLAANQSVLATESIEQLRSEVAASMQQTIRLQEKCQQLIDQHTYEIEPEARYNYPTWRERHFNAGDDCNQSSGLVYAWFYFVRQLYGRSMRVRLYLTTPLQPEQYNSQQWSRIWKEGDTIIFERDITPGMDNCIRPEGLNAQPRAHYTITEDVTMRARVSYLFSNAADAAVYATYMSESEEERDSHNYGMRYLHVGMSYNYATEGWGVTHFADPLSAARSIYGTAHHLYNHPLLRCTIMIDEAGTYDLSAQCSIAHDLDGSSARGIMIGGTANPDSTGRYVSFTTADPDHPERYVLLLDGAYGLPSDYHMTRAQCMRMQIFCIQYGSEYRGTISGMTLAARNARYCLHPETAAKGRDGRWTVDRCVIHYMGSPRCDEWAGAGVGIGISAEEEGTIARCRFTTAAEGAVNNGIVGHNNGYSNTYDDADKAFIGGARLTLRSCNLGGWDVGPLHDNAPNQSEYDLLSIDNCKGIGEVIADGNWRVRQG